MHRNQILIENILGKIGKYFRLQYCSTTTVLHRSQRLKYPIGSQRNSRLNDMVQSDMELTFIGTSSSLPASTRKVSCISFRHQSEFWLFDCGESSQLQLQNSFLTSSKIKKIFITHLHGDHSFGLPGVLCMIGCSKLSIVLSKLDTSDIVDIYGPPGIRDYLRASLQLTYSRISVSYRVHELKNVPNLHCRNPVMPRIKTVASPEYGEIEEGRDIYPNSDGHYHLFEENDLVVTAAPLQHSVPCVGYVIHEKPQKGNFMIDKVRSLVIQNKEALMKQYGLQKSAARIYGILNEMNYGDVFTFPDGTRIAINEIIGPIRPGTE